MTVPGRGYRFLAEVKVGEEEAGRGAASGEIASGTKNNVEERMADRPLPTARQTGRAGHSPRWIWAASILAILGAGVVLFILWPGQSGHAPAVPSRTIAILPFKPLVPQHRDRVLEMGMADTLITKLGNSQEFVVRPLSSVRKYDALEQDPMAAGRELKVESILDGDIQRSGDHVRVTTRLIKVSDGSSLWAGTFDEKFTDVFAVQDAISQRSCWLSRCN